MNEAPTRQRASLGRRLAVAVILLAAGLLLAWFTTPQWVPAAAGWFLPDGWRVEHMTLRRPALGSTRIDQLRLRGDAAGAAVTVDARDALIAHRGPAIVIQDLAVSLRPAPESREEAPAAPWRDRLALPAIPSGGAWPVLTVSRFTLRMGAPGQEKNYDIENLRLARTDGGARLSGTLAPVPFLSVNGLVSAELRDDGIVDAVLAIEETPDDPLLRYRQQADGSVAGARLSLDLALVDVEALAPWSAAAGIGPVLEASGQVAASLELEGADLLRPASGAVEFSALALTSEALRVNAEGAIAVGGISGSAPGLRTERFEAAIGLAREDWLSDLEARLESAGVRGLLARAPAQLGLVFPGQAVLDLDMDSGTFAFDGSVSFLWRQEPAATVELASPALRAARAAGGAFSLAADGLSAALEHRGIVHARFGELSMEGEGASIRLRGDARVDPGAEPRLDLALDTATARRFVAGLPGLHGEARNLSVEGRLGAEDGGFRFEGPVSADALRAAEAPGAAALLSAATARAVLALDDSDRLSTRGPMELSGVGLLEDSLRMGRLDIELDELLLGRGDGAFNAVTTGLERVVDGKAMGGLDLDLDGTLEAWSRAEGSGEALAGLAKALPFRWRADLDSGATEIRFENAELEANGLRGALRPLGVTLPEPLKFRSGSVFLDGVVELAPADGGLSPRGGIGLRAERLAFDFGETRVDGLDFRSSVALDEAFRSDGRLSAETISLAAGLELTGLDTGLRTGGDTEFGLEGLSAELLGGRLEAVELSVAGGMPQAATIEWLGFDLGRLLAFLDVDGLDGTGTMDAHFPIASEGGSLIVEDGEFAARGPGRIRYSTGAPAANIGLQALENFEYDSLDGKVNYAADGAYTIALRLLGRNPDLYGGHPVRFRLNLGGELPALFRSLFVTGDFDRAIVERLRSSAGELDE